MWYELFTKLKTFLPGNMELIPEFRCIKTFTQISPSFAKQEARVSHFSHCTLLTCSQANLEVKGFTVL